MLTVNKLLPAGRGLAPALLRRGTELSLDWDTRSKSRFDAVDALGRTLGVFLPRGSVLRGGDVLVAEDGSLIRVLAAAQPVLVVRSGKPQGGAFDLLRAAYHLGNRHVALELQPDHLKLEPDHVLAEMLRGMQLLVEETAAAFEPEAGAYQAVGHGHGHGHGHGPAPGADAALKAIPVHAHAHAHVHGPGCGHDHGHGSGDSHPHAAGKR